MALTIRCPNLRCRKILMVPTASRGTRVRCAYCNTVLLVPWSKDFNDEPFKLDPATTVAREKNKKNKEEEDS